MGGSTISDCLTNNFLEDNQDVKIMFVRKQNSFDSDINCYIDEKFKPINMPFNAKFSEDYRIEKIEKDYNTKQIEEYFGISIKTFTELVLHKPRAAFGEYDNLFFKAFKINHPYYENSNKYLANYENCKTLNSKFELIESNEQLESFSINSEYIFTKLKLYFQFDKIENKLSINIFQLKKDEEIFYKNINFSKNERSNLRNVFDRLYDLNIPIFMNYETLDKIKEIEKIFPMIYSTNINTFIESNLDKNDQKKEVDKCVNDLITYTLDYIEKVKEKERCYFDINTILSKAHLLNRSSNNELFKNIYFEKFADTINDLLYKKEDITKEKIIDLLNVEELSKNLIEFTSLTNIMNRLNLEFKTFSLTGFPDRDFEVSWNEHCKEDSLKSLELSNDFER